MKLTFLVVAATTLSFSPAVAVAAPHPAPQHRASLRLSDGAGDTWTYSDTTVGYTPAPQPAADVLSARIHHGRYAVTTRMLFANLTRESTQWYRCEIHVAGLTHWYIVEAAEGHWRGIAYEEVQGEWVRAPGVTHKIDYAAETFTLRVPRRLLGDPAWVRVRLHNDLGIGDGTFFTDNPMSAGHKPLYTPRIPAR